MNGSLDKTLNVRFNGVDHCIAVMEKNIPFLKEFSPRYLRGQTLRDV